MRFARRSLSTASSACQPCRVCSSRGTASAEAAMGKRPTRCRLRGGGRPSVSKSTFPFQGFAELVAEAVSLEFQRCTGTSCLPPVKVEARQDAREAAGSSSVEENTAGGSGQLAKAEATSGTEQGRSGQSGCPPSSSWVLDGITEMATRAWSDHLSVSQKGSILAKEESVAVPAFSVWLGYLPEKCRPQYEEATAGLEIAGVMSPPPAGSRNRCGFIVLILVLADLVAAEYVTLDELLSAWRGLPRLLPGQLQALVSIIAFSASMPNSRARAAWAAEWFGHSFSWFATDALRRIVHGCLLPRVSSNEDTEAVLDEWAINDADLDLAAAEGEAVPVGVFATFLALFPARVAIITECGGHVGRRDIGEVGAALLCGMMVRDGHMHYLPASEVLPPASKPEKESLAHSSPEPVPPQWLAVMLHMHGSVTTFAIDPGLSANEINMAIDGVCAALPAHERRLVLDGRRANRIDLPSRKV